MSKSKPCTKLIFLDQVGGSIGADSQTASANTSTLSPSSTSVSILVMFPHFQSGSFYGHSAKPRPPEASRAPTAVLLSFRPAALCLPSVGHSQCTHVLAWSSIWSLRSDSRLCCALCGEKEKEAACCSNLSERMLTRQLVQTEPQDLTKVLQGLLGQRAGPANFFHSGNPWRQSQHPRV